MIGYGWYATHIKTESFYPNFPLIFFSLSFLCHLVAPSTSSDHDHHTSPPTAHRHRRHFPLTAGDNVQKLGPPQATAIDLFPTYSNMVLSFLVFLVAHCCSCTFICVAGRWIWSGFCCYKLQQYAF